MMRCSALRRGYTVSPIVWITLVVAILVGIVFMVYRHHITTPAEDVSKPVVLPGGAQYSTEPADTEPATEPASTEPTSRP
jgi:hypothetical protein